MFTSSSVFTYHKNFESTKDPFPTPKRWLQMNDYMFEPQSPDEPKRRAVYYHVRDNIKYSPKKMWYICCLVRGLSVDEAIKQLSFVPKKGAVLAKEVLEEAQEKAMATGLFEFKSNMWIGQCHATKGVVFKGIRKHARFRMGEIRCFHTHLFYALVEGPPQQNYYFPGPLTNKQRLDAYVNWLRERRITNSI